MIATAAPFRTLSTAMVTPFRASGELDLDSTARLARKLVADGCDAILVSGTTGESPTTHRPEKEELISCVRAAVGEDVFIIAGAGSNDTLHAQAMAASATEAGADGLLVVSPYYNRPSQRGLLAHVRAVADVSDLPIMLYDIPGRTGLAFSDEVLDELAKNPQIQAVKDATGNVVVGEERSERTGLAYYSGDDGLNYSWLAHGASGCVSVVGHVAASSYRDMIAKVREGDLPGAREISVRLRPLVHAIMGGGQGAVMAKHALHMMGVIESPRVRLPLVEATASELEALEAALVSAGLLS
ncbi:4-hydroxy-tetrahydrodipicolinate synthase [Nanchangia anserum]|uniref:4-hydroxy-tetrahydrodipicolinate synthase n=1 Tax=Nanchangia anserum TaxID=2692125 RepID=A0A8I0GHY3_9ACTO|nr:4-hydroxy-tetrahydrodipicolinate synthase [Nanchangia anserum]MBD3690274.1 4-hydroxy-tetrahydrodipicolinate synthase [Nanchangia anserum]QOX82288.1 4-hydroxy-tetrahydrodipicolinate synthase [Nanchangia anserum]